MPALFAISGPLKGAVFQLAGEEVSIGRHTSSQLCVGDPSVSREHCVVESAAFGFRIRDAGSNHGTFVNGERVEERTLADGDQIRIGDTVFRFQATLEGGADDQLAVPDNSLVANSDVQRPLSDSTEAAALRLLEAARESALSASARALLQIGAGLSCWREPEMLAQELIKRIVDIVPADRAAVVLLAPNTVGEPTLCGWDCCRQEVSPVEVSRTIGLFLPSPHGRAVPLPR